MNILLIQELDLFTECCLQCESLFVTNNFDKGAALMRDCADLNILLSEFVKRKSEIEKPLLICCIEAWFKCKELLEMYKSQQEFERCYDVCLMCIEDYKNYI